MLSRITQNVKDLGGGFQSALQIEDGPEEGIKKLSKGRLRATPQNNFFQGRSLCQNGGLGNLVFSFFIHKNLRLGGGLTR